MDFECLAESFKALADPTRLKIVALLKLRHWCVGELVPLFGISQPAVSKHITRLKSSGLVNESRQGMWVFYSLNNERLDEIGISLHSLPDMTAELNAIKEKGLFLKCDTTMH